MMKLPFKYPPIVDSYSGSAGVIGAMQMYNKYDELIFMNNYLITYDVKSEAPGFNWGYYNDDYTIDIDVREEAKGNEALSIVDWLNQKYYIHLVLDHFYIHNSECYKKMHKTHDCATILGYDECKKVFWVADNFKNGKYTIEEVSFEEVNDARKNITELQFDKLELVQDPVFTMNKKALKSLLISYREGQCLLDGIQVNNKNMELIEDNSILYGSRMYDILVEYVKRLKNGEYDIRPFHVMYNHMCLYELLIKIFDKKNIYIDDKEKINRDVLELINASRHMRYIYLKLNIKWSSETYDSLMKNLNNMREKEVKLIAYFLNIIESI